MRNHVFPAAVLAVGLLPFSVGGCQKNEAPPPIITDTGAAPPATATVIPNASVGVVPQPIASSPVVPHVPVAPVPTTATTATAVAPKASAGGKGGAPAAAQPGFPFPIPTTWPSSLPVPSNLPPLPGFPPPAASAKK